MPIPAVVGAALIGGGASVAAGAIGAHAAGKAADTQAKAGQQALDLQKQVLSQQQANIQPFLDTGGASLSRLRDLTAARGNRMNVPLGTPQAPQPQRTAGTLVPIQAPDGKIYMVPAAQQKAAIASGGKFIQ